MSINSKNFNLVTKIQIMCRMCKLSSLADNIYFYGAKLKKSILKKQRRHNLREIMPCPFINSQYIIQIQVQY